MLSILYLCFGCAKDERSIPSDYVVLGRGFTNTVEIGMTIDEVHRSTRNIIVHETRPKWKIFGPVTYTGEILALGLRFVVKGKRQPIGQIVLNVSNRESNTFRGRLSAGLSFEKKPVSRADVVGIFGEPGFTNVAKFMLEGKNVTWKLNATKEIIYYPRAGAIFRFTDGNVDTITLIPLWKE